MERVDDGPSAAAAARPPRRALRRRQLARPLLRLRRADTKRLVRPPLTLSVMRSTADVPSVQLLPGGRPPRALHPPWVGSLWGPRPRLDAARLPPRRPQLTDLVGRRRRLWDPAALPPLGRPGHLHQRDRARSVPTPPRARPVRGAHSLCMRAVLGYSYIHLEAHDWSFWSLIERAFLVVGWLVRPHPPVPCALDRFPARSLTSFLPCRPSSAAGYSAWAHGGGFGNALMKFSSSSVRPSPRRRTHTLTVAPAFKRLTQSPRRYRRRRRLARRRLLPRLPARQPRREPPPPVLPHARPVGLRPRRATSTRPVAQHEPRPSSASRSGDGVVVAKTARRRRRPPRRVERLRTSAHPSTVALVHLTRRPGLVRLHLVLLGRAPPVGEPPFLDQLAAARARAPRRRPRRRQRAVDAEQLRERVGAGQVDAPRHALARRRSGSRRRGRAAAHGPVRRGGVARRLRAPRQAVLRLHAGARRLARRSSFSRSLLGRRPTARSRRARRRRGGRPPRPSSSAAAHHLRGSVRRSALLAPVRDRSTGAARRRRERHRHGDEPARRPRAQAPAAGGRDDVREGGHRVVGARGRCVSFHSSRARGEPA